MNGTDAEPPAVKATPQGNEGTTVSSQFKLVQLWETYRSKWRLGVLGSALLIGAVVGVLFLYPVNDFVYYQEYGAEDGSAWEFVFKEMADNLKWRNPYKTTFYALIGAALGLTVGFIYRTLEKRQERITELTNELGKDLQALIAQGESALLEFKSSFRWDLKENRLNRILEGVIMKTLAGFMNGMGGTLIIGVADDGKIVGLDKDYQILRKKDRDGFEQLLVTTIANQIGADLAPWIQTVFHVVDDLEVCRVIVHPAPRPVYVKHGNNTTFYLRTGPSTRELDVEETVAYVSSRWP